MSEVMLWHMNIMAGCHMMGRCLVSKQKRATIKASKILGQTVIQSNNNL